MFGARRRRLRLCRPGEALMGRRHGGPHVNTAGSPLLSGGMAQGPRRSQASGELRPDLRGAPRSGRGARRRGVPDPSSGTEFVRRHVFTGEPAFVEMWKKFGGPARDGLDEPWLETNRARLVEAVASDRPSPRSDLGAGGRDARPAGGGMSGVPPSGERRRAVGGGSLSELADSGHGVSNVAG